MHRLTFFSTSYLNQSKRTVEAIARELHKNKWRTMVQSNEVKSELDVR